MYIGEDGELGHENGTGDEQGFDVSPACLVLGHMLMNIWLVWDNRKKSSSVTVQR